MMLPGFAGGYLLEHQVDLLHEQEEPVWIGRERGELVLKIKIASTLLGVHDDCPARHKFGGLPCFMKCAHEQDLADALSP
jgi:hypothetical protein